MSLRRVSAAANCVVAFSGNERSDFGELHNYLRIPNDAVTRERLIGTHSFPAPSPLD